MSVLKNIIKFILTLVFLFVPNFYLDADIIDDLKNKISDRVNNIEKLQKEIKEQQKKLDEVEKEKMSLQRAVKTLDISRSRIKTNINITKNKIIATDLNIKKLNLQINSKTENINENKKRLGNVIRMMSEIDDNSLAELILSGSNISTYWDQTERLASFQKGIRDNINELLKIKEKLELDKEKREKENQRLLNLKDEYEDQKRIADQNRREKNNLLKQTKNKESNYKKMLAEKLALKKQFEQELLDFESQLQFALDPNTLPPEGSRVLAWPLDYIYVTQQFGFTEGGKRLYKKGWHNGADFRARTPKRIKSAASGIVVGTGNTDLTCKGASFGKWVLVRHYNGLSTLYAHMSLIKVSEGQKLTTGDTIGYTGNTGYSTAPHLHLGVYASDGVNVKQLPSKACGGKTYTLPLAAHSAYLDPLAYLPEL